MIAPELLLIRVVEGQIRFALRGVVVRDSVLYRNLPNISRHVPNADFRTVQLLHRGNCLAQSSSLAAPSLGDYGKVVLPNRQLGTHGRHFQEPVGPILTLWGSILISWGHPHPFVSFLSARYEHPLVLHTLCRPCRLEQPCIPAVSWVVSPNRHATRRQTAHSASRRPVFTRQQSILYMKLKERLQFGNPQ